MNISALICGRKPVLCRILALLACDLVRPALSMASMLVGMHLVFMQ
jgi:hypothetical protein